jgi:uncharacterized protein YyaL (SSP411 family)
MPNRLAAEKSPYLRQHADNPVDWFPWGEAALAKARAEQKPIFLSIGYSTCHWCHVMAHESFEHPGIAAVLNTRFVPVKLDREERPDLDRVYMAYVQHTTGHGGWPMSVWLTPEGKPFYGGTYFPPDDRSGRPGFKTVLEAIARHWSEQREKILSGADEIVQALRRYAVEGPAHEVQPEGAPALPHEAVAGAFEQGFQYFYEAHDPRWGGFGGAPKFPRASVIDFLFRVAVLQGLQTDAGQEAVKMAAHTLQRMAEGGLHDHLGGGFHRYSVDEQWHVPHFEKMLYDQAQIALNLLEARQATGIEVYAWVARGIFDYVRRDLTGPHGGFYSAEDADSPLPQDEAGRVVPDADEPPNEAIFGSSGGFAPSDGKHAEGAFYVWTRTEIDRVLGADSTFFCRHYGVEPAGNVAADPHGEFQGRNVLRQRRPLAQTAQDAGLTLEAAVEKLLACQEKLRTVRARRPRPSLDDQVIAAWNGLMISALARGAQVLEATRPEGSPCLQAATRAAEFMMRELYDHHSGVLYRSWRAGRSAIPGFAEDYAYLIQGLLDLYEAGFDLRWLQWAVRLQAKMDELFWDANLGGYFNSRADDADVIVRLKEDHDGAEPAPSTVAATNLLRLDWLLGLPGARDRAEKTIEAFRAQWSRAPHGLPGMLCAAALALEAPRTVVLAGDPAAEDFRALAAVLHERLGPRRGLLHADGGAGQRWLAVNRPYLAEMKSRAGRAVAFVCEDFTCHAPAERPEELREMIARA